MVLWQLFIKWNGNDQLFINKLVYLGFSILNFNEIVIYEWWCDSIKVNNCLY